MERIKSYSEFTNDYPVTEGIADTITKLLPWLKTKAQGLKGWAGKFFAGLKDGAVKIIKGGPNKGKPAAMLFMPENGSIVSQVKAVYGGRVSESTVPLEWYGDDESIRQVNAEDLVEDITMLYRRTVELKRGEGKHRATPIFIYGAPGIGKTQIVAQAAEDLGCNLMFLDIQNYSPEDLVGVPTVVNGRTVNNPPVMLPEDNGPNGKGGILFLDEMNRADDNTLKKLLRFIQSGVIGTYTLPSKWVIVAAGNRPIEADVPDPDPAFADRFSIVNYVPELGLDEEGKASGGWAKWAKDKVMPEVVYFLGANKGLFHSMKAGVTNVNFPTPRSWSLASMELMDVIKLKGVSDWRNLPTRTIQNIFTDKVGRDAAAKFVEFLEVLKQFTPEDMKTAMSTPDNARVVPQFNKEKRFLYVITKTLMDMAGDDEAKHANIIQYIDRYNQDEITSWALKQTYEKLPQMRNTSNVFSSDKNYDDRVKMGRIMQKATKNTKDILTSMGR
jgi:hypothetical protein